MTRQTLLALIVATALVATAIGPAAASSTPPTYRIDADHDLATEDALATYEETGSVSTAIQSPAMNVTIASEAATCGVDANSLSDARNDYLCVDYQQQTSVTLRLHIPQEYWHPYVRENQESITSDTTATVEPTQNGNYTSYRFSVDGPTKVVFAVPEDVTLTYNLVERASERSESLVGVEIWNSGTSWRYVNGTTFGDDAAIAIKAKPGDTQLQYDAEKGTGTTWLTIPNGQDSNAPVYWFQRQGEPKTIYIVSTVGANEAPQIRYRATGGGIGGIDQALDQIARVDDWLEKVLEDVIPDGLPGGGPEDGDTTQQARVSAR